MEKPNEAHLYQLSAENEELRKMEAEFMRRHKGDSDQKLIEYLRACADELGHIPKKREVVGFTYLKWRLGPWPRVLERAGLKNRRIARENIAHLNKK